MMPVSTLSGAVSTSIYVASLLLLLGSLIYPAESAFNLSRHEAAQMTANAIAHQLDALSPGVTASLEVAPLPAAILSVTLGGRAVTVSVDGAVSSAYVRWQLPTTKILPGHTYLVSDRDGVVEIA